MIVGLISLLAVLFIAALGGTLYVFRQEENKMNKLEDKGDTAENELARSREYESSSLKHNIPLQLAIYGVTLVLVIVIFVIYVV
ncbi:hypothetical protein GCM10028778_01800 [Barrientosiimonas marina]|uniref:DUF3899 domain-containing protein n=1 Tax=Lentibacillus kimchii TaxID=1542911 RepID=A0ABW2UPM5_9BACI